MRDVDPDARHAREARRIRCLSQVPHHVIRCHRRLHHLDRRLRRRAWDDDAMRPMTDGSRFARATLVGDLLGLFAFLVLGLDRHGEDVVARFAALASIFAAAWLVTAWFLGTYRPPTYARLL